ncbi:unnamed protein product [Rotaria sp. Silwood2]|nr:unnamed protein product [Rotaria sp. Silwood2]
MHSHSISEAPDTYWNSTQFLAWLYNDSPVKNTVVVNDRWGRETPCKHGDFYTCSDRYNPGYLIEHKWENAFTIDKISWGYRPTANIEDYMTIEELLKELVITISTGGNVLINVGPNLHGKIPPIYQERLRQMGSWLQVNGEAIYATKPWKYQNDSTNPNVWYTSSKDTKFVYALLPIWPKDNSEIILGAPLSSSKTVVTLLGSSIDSLPWRVASGDRGIVIDVSQIKLHSLQSGWTWAFKLENLLPDNGINPTPGFSIGSKCCNGVWFICTRRFRQNDKMKIFFFNCGVIRIVINPIIVKHADVMKPTIEYVNEYKCPVKTPYIIKMIVGQRNAANINNNTTMRFITVKSLKFRCRCFAAIISVAGRAEPRINFVIHA